MNMCSHKFEKDANKSCKWDKFFSQVRLKETGITNDMLNLPHDSTGECIFHSRDLEWKRKNNFTNWLNKLIFLLDNYDNENEEIELDEVIFVGNSLLEEQEVKHKMRANSENELYCFMFEKMFCKKNICFNNSKFEDIIILERCCLKNDLILQNCHFSKGISIERFAIGGDLHIYNSHFQKRIVIADNDRANTIYGGLYIEYSTFVGDSSFSELIITESCEIKNNEFKHIENEICFNCKFLSGLVFSDNSITDLAFSSCGFYYDTIFERLKLLGKFSIFNPQIGGQLKFVGSENDLLFNSKTTIEINSECFEENGMIIFDYCNVLNLGTTFIENCRNLEAKQKVIIHPSCKVERLTMIYEYPLDTELKSNLIEDFANIVSKYFYLWYGINLSVNIIRNRAKKIITVVYKTTDNITDEDFNSLLKKLPEAICYTQKNEPAIIDLQRALFYIIERINSISDNAFKNIFSNILINTRGKYIKNKTDIGTLNEKNNEKTLTENVKEYVEECVKNAFEKYVKDGEKTVIQVQGDYIYSQNGVVVGGENNTLKKSVVKRQSNEHYVDKSAINISLEKKKSFWNGVIGALIIGVIGCAIWYFIQTLIIKR